MAIQTVIRRRRLELGLTQEQVAQRLGVTAPAVNKWERGATCPDIALLGPLARLLQTDINALLCFQEDLTQEEITRYTQEVAETAQAAGLAAGFQQGRERLQAYPNCDLLLQNLTLVLEGELMMAPLPPEEQASYEAELWAMYQRLADSEDEALRCGAAYMLAAKHLAREEYQAAQTQLDRIPERTGVDKRQLQAALFQRQGQWAQAAEILERKCLGIANELQMTLFALTSCARAAGEREAAGEIAKICAKAVDLLGLWAYGKSVGTLEAALDGQSPQAAIAAVEELLAAMLRPWDMGASVLYRHIAPAPQTEEAPGLRLLPGLLRELETDPKYAFLRESPDFPRLLERYGPKCPQDSGVNPTAANTAPASSEER